MMNLIVKNYKKVTHINTELQWTVIIFPYYKNKKFPQAVHTAKNKINTHQRKPYNCTGGYEKTSAPIVECGAAELSLQEITSEDVRSLRQPDKDNDVTLRLFQCLN